MAGPPELAACQYGVFSLFGTVWFVWLGLQMWRYICLLRSKGTFDGIRHMSSMTGEGRREESRECRVMHCDVSGG